MKSKSIFTIIAFLFALSSIQAQGPTAIKMAGGMAWKPGEKFTYNAYFNWGVIWINAATIEFTVTDATYDDEPVYKIQLKGETVKTFKMLHFVNKTTTYMDKNNLTPHFMRQESYEPDYYAIDNYTFSNTDTNHMVIIDSEREKGNSSDTIITKQPHYDLMSMLYRMRDLDLGNLKMDQKVPMPMVFNDGAYDLYLRYDGKEQVKMKNGKVYNCIRMKPSLAEGKFFEKGEGMTIYFSDDGNHVPLYIESKMKVGYIKAMIDQIENTVFPMSSEVTTEKKK